MLLRPAQIGDQGHMDEQAVLISHLQSDLAHSLQKRLGFNIPDGPSDLCDHHVRICLFSHAVHEFLDLIGNMRDHLDRGAQVFSSPLFVENVPVDLSGCQIGVLVQVLVNEPLIVAQIQVGFRPVLGHIYLSVLVRTHGPRIDIDIRIQLLGRHLQAPGL